MKLPQALIAGVLSQHLTLALAAPPAPPAILSSGNVDKNLTAPFEFGATISENLGIIVPSNVTKKPSNLTFAPPDPCDFVLPNTGITLRLFDFDSLAPFARSLDLELFRQATKDAVETHKQASVPIGLDLVYTATSDFPGSTQKVLLAFFPGPQATWQILKWVIDGLIAFTYEFEDVGLEFIVIQKHQGKVAEGHILNDPGNKIQAPATDSE